MSANKISSNNGSLKKHLCKIKYIILSGKQTKETSVEITKCGNKPKMIISSFKRKPKNKTIKDTWSLLLTKDSDLLRFCLSHWHVLL